MSRARVIQSRWCSVHLIGLLMTVGCASGVSGDDGGPDDPPTKVKQPPIPKTGSDTAPNCEGVPESGQCVDGVATFCDVGANALRRKDCKALGKSCIVNSTRGAVCETIAAPAGGGATACDTGVTYEGSCGGAGGNTAVWCDPASKQTFSWDCDNYGLSCAVNECGTGAYCCAAGAPPPTNECATLGFAGTCGGAGNNTARWCDSATSTTVNEKACANGQTCQVDACAMGAYCCDAAPAPVSECDTIGMRGVCTAAGAVRWCSNGTVNEVSCGTTTSCQIDQCGDGAYCCAP
jgi:hypothetical protein